MMLYRQKISPYARDGRLGVSQSRSGWVGEGKIFTLCRESKVETADLCTDAQFVNHLVCWGEGVMV